MLPHATFDADSEYHVYFECKSRRDLGSMSFFEVCVRTANIAWRL